MYCSTAAKSSQPVCVQECSVLERAPSRIEKHTYLAVDPFLYCRCGCARPAPHVSIFTNPSNGCSPTCKEQPQYQSSLAALPCLDAQPNSTQLKLYADQFAEMAEGRVGPSGGLIRQVLGAGGCQVWLRDIRSTFKKLWGMPAPPGGSDQRLACGYWDAKTKQEVGPVGGPLKALTMLCPDTCGCKAGDYGCPASCPRSNTNSTLLRVD